MTSKLVIGGLKMDKKEILEKIKNDDKGLDEMERVVIGTASKYAKAVGGVVCMLFALISLLLYNKANIEIWCVYTSMMAVENLYLYSRLKNKRYIWIGIMEIILLAGWIVLYILRIVGEKIGK